MIAKADYFIIFTMNSVTAERDVKLLRVQPQTSPTVEPGLSVSL